MRRNTLYIILSIITILSLFITAATCSFCGRQLGTVSSDDTKIDVEEDETVPDKLSDIRPRFHRPRTCGGEKIGDEVQHQEFECVFMCN